MPQDPLKNRTFSTNQLHLLKTVPKTLAEWSVCHCYPVLLRSGPIHTLQLLVLSQAESNFVISWTKLVKFPIGFWNRLVHLVGVVLGDFPAAVVAKANSPGIEKSRHSIMTPARLTRVSTKETSWKRKLQYNDLRVVTWCLELWVHSIWWSVIQDHSVSSTSKNQQTPFRKWFIHSLDVPWSQWSQISEPDPDHPRGMHPIIMLKVDFESAVSRLSSCKIQSS